MTTTNSPNAFQLICRDRVRDQLNTVGHKIEFEWVKGDGSYLNAHLRGLFECRGHGIEVFIHENQLQFGFAGWWDSFEKCAYPTVESLLEDAKSSLARFLETDPVAYPLEHKLNDQVELLRLAAIMLLLFAGASVASSVLLESGWTRTLISGTTAAVAVLALAWAGTSLVRLMRLRKERKTEKSEKSGTGKSRGHPW